MTKTFLLALIILASVNFCFSQVNDDAENTTKADANSCEMNSLYFDMISNKVAESKERIFAIFRAGKGETESVNAKRLAHVKTFLEQSKGWKRFDVIYARGEKSDGEGQIEFYVGGKLFLISHAQ